jgi:hypothetical protein
MIDLLVDDTPFYACGREKSGRGRSESSRDICLKIFLVSLSMLRHLYSSSIDAAAPFHRFSS